MTALRFNPIAILAGALSAAAVAGTISWWSARTQVAIQAPSAQAAATDGRALLVSFERHETVWVSVRASAETRVEGWGAELTTAVLVVYPKRDFNPAFTGAAPMRVAWMDGDRVVALADPTGAGHLSPPQEVTAAVLLPPDEAPKVQAGDRFRLVGPGA